MAELATDVARLVEDVNYGPVWVDREADRIAILTGPASRTRSEPAASCC